MLAEGGGQAVYQKYTRDREVVSLKGESGQDGAYTWGAYTYEDTQDQEEDPFFMGPSWDSVYRTV